MVAEQFEHQAHWANEVSHTERSSERSGGPYEQALELFDTSVKRILLNDLHYYPYKLMLEIKF